MKATKEVSILTLKRLPLYLDYLEECYAKQIEYISTPTIALKMGLTDTLVKKDLLEVTSTKGKPKVGHKVISLINDIKQYLFLSEKTKAVLVGAGSLGKALLGFEGFEKWNVKIVAAFDNDETIIGKKVNNVPILNIIDMKDFCVKQNIHIGIITTPKSYAQVICDQMIEANVKAIWNFAPVILESSNEVIIQNENFAAGLAVLSKRLSNVI